MTGHVAAPAAVLDALPALVAVLDGHGLIVAVNAPRAKIGGADAWPFAECRVGGDYPALCDAVTGPQAAPARRAAAGIRAVLAGSDARYAQEYELESPAGARWLRLMVEPMAGAGAVVMHIDISGFKHAEAATRRSADLLRAVVAGTPDVVFIKDRDSRYLLCNDAGARFAGHTVEEMVGQRVDAIFAADDARVMMESDRLVLESELPRTDEEVVRGAGAVRTVLTTKAPYRNDLGEVVGVIGIVRDITARKAAERERERERKLLRTLIDALPDAIYTRDGEGRFVLSNRAAQAMFGLAREEDLAGKTVFDLLPEAAAKRADEVDRQVLGGKSIHDREEMSAGPGGAAHWQLTTKVPLRDDRGAVGGFVGIERDISAAKRDHEALRELNAELERRVDMRTADLNKASHDAEQANRAKSAFLATMSHEIRTPMNGVIGLLDVLHRTSLDGHQMEMVDLIRDSASSLVTIIDDVLDFSKIEAGMLITEHQPMEVAEIVEKVCSMLDQMALDRGVRVSIFVDPALPRVIAGDANRLRQVLVNLVSNAIKFCSGRPLPGRVSVRALLEERDAGNAKVAFVVADNGIGMDSPTLDRLFNPFVQADVTTTRRYGGSGLGLAISENLVKAMGGKVSVQSTVGLGSTFTVRLPAAIGAGSRPALPVAALDCRIVGSEQPLAGDLATTLRDAGHRVDHAIDLAAAVAAGQGAGARLWLVLPGVSIPGLHDLRKLAPGQPAAQTRFIVFGWGKRRRPRVDAADLVSIDVDVLTREALHGVIAVAAGSAPATVDVPASADVAALLALPVAELRAGTVLVAEDNETNRKVILLQLRLLGYAAAVAVDGREALELWRRGSFSLLLTDLQMPDMDGYALTRAIRAEEAGQRRLPIIALTANVIGDEELRCLGAGMDAYLTKPVRLPELKAAIEFWLAGRPGSGDGAAGAAAASPLH